MFIFLQACLLFSVIQPSDLIILNNFNLKLEYVTPPTVPDSIQQEPNYIYPLYFKETEQSKYA